MEVPKSPRKKPSFKNKNPPQQEIFTPEEKEKISHLIYEENNQEFMKLFEEYLSYSKSSHPKLELTITKIKTYLNTKRKSLSLNSLDSNLNSINFLLSHLKERFDFDHYHFVELFIFFYEFIAFNEEEKDYLLDKESFIKVNLSLFSILKKNSNQNEEDFEKKMLKDIFKYLKISNRGINLENLIYYLRQLTIVELSRENIFRVLDKAGKGSVSEEEVNNILRGVEEFVVLCDEGSKSHSSLDLNCSEVVKIIFEKNKNSRNSINAINEKQIKEKFEKNPNLFNFFIYIFEQAEKIIEKMTTDSKKPELENILHQDYFSDENTENKNIFKNLLDENEKENSETLNFGNFGNSEEMTRNVLSSEKIINTNRTASSNQGNNINNTNMLKKIPHAFSNPILEENFKENADIEDKQIISRNFSNPIPENIDFIRRISFGEIENKIINAGPNTYPHTHIPKQSLGILKKLNSGDTEFNFSPDKESKKLIQLICGDQNLFELSENEEKNLVSMVEQIKLQSCLYDLPVAVFIREIFILKNSKNLNFLNFLKKSEKIEKSEKSEIFQKINQNQFIDILLNIINKHTTGLNIYSKTKALADLYTLLKNENSNEEIYFDEMVGAVLILCPGSEEDKIQSIFDYLHFEEEESFPKNRFILTLSGIIKLVFSKSDLNSLSLQKMKPDSRIIAEAVCDKILNRLNNEEYSWKEKLIEVFKQFLGENFENLENLEEKLENLQNLEKLEKEDDLLKKLQNLDKNENLEKNELNYIDKGVVPPLHKENLEPYSPLFNLESEFFQIISEKIENLRNLFYIPEVNVLQVVEILKSKALIGFINKPQFIDSVNQVFDILERYEIPIPESEKMTKITLLSNILSLNSSTTQLFDIIEITCPLLILLGGSTEEKVHAIFKIFDKEKGDKLNYFELSSFINKLFTFIFNHIGDLREKEEIVENLTKILTNDIFNNFELEITSPGIEIEHLLDYYYFLY